ncbi:uncharacterized protein Smp_203800 [Schistosoma mansoni]|uniref:uncharacterized protein n=1 Tax=Schistosoma mansoni TaxID=6183 RepID=UPI00022DCC66|nr:uncharacterized protein Smp_203800 [Schistosoma mansoni]|eukprot:XP_018655157.1 uncharacterized protein Smp_203800 [Schistosoma mansoni]
MITSIHLIRHTTVQSHIETASLPSHPLWNHTSLLFPMRRQTTLVRLCAFRNKNNCTTTLDRISSFIN